MTTLVLATHNAGKVKEIAHVLSELQWHVATLDQFNVPPCEEPAATFIENALIKARYAAEQTNLPALADDSGLVVPALNGAPGIYSARYAGTPSNTQANWQKLLTELADREDRSAYFYTCLVFLRHANDPTPIIAEGTLHGQIGFEPKGSNGFGYDPLFYMPELKCTTAELSLEEKNKISHRAKALNVLKHRLNK